MAVREKIMLDDSDFAKGLKRVEARFEAVAERQSKTFASESKKAGKRSAEEMVKQLRDTYSSKRADLKEALAKGVIDKREFRRETTKIKDAINQDALQAIERFRNEGELTQEDYKKLTGVLKQTGSAAKRAGDKGEKAAKGWRARVDRVKSSLASAKTAVVGLATAFVAGVGARIGKKLFDIGTAAEETESKLQAVFGAASDDVGQFAKDYGQAAGVVERKAEDTVATTGAILQGLGFMQEESAATVKEVFRLSADLASFNNVQGGAAEVAGALNAALTGERERLKQLGIVLRETDVVERALANTGKETAAALTDQEKATASLQLVTERAGKAVGDLERTFGSNANRARRVRATFGNIVEDVAQGLLPAFDKLITKLEQALPTVQKFGRGLAGFVETSLGMLDPAAMMAGEEISSIRAQGFDQVGISQRLQVEREGAEDLKEEIAEVGELMERKPDVFFDTAAGEVRDLQTELEELENQLAASEKVMAFLRGELGRPQGGGPAGGGGGGSGGGVRRGPGRIEAPAFDPGEFEDFSEVGRAAAETTRQIMEETVLLSGELAGPLSSALHEVTLATQSVTEAELALQRVLVDPESSPEEIAAAEERLADAKENLRQKVAAILGPLEEQGVSQEKLAGITKNLVKRLKDAGVNVDDLAEGADEGAEAWEEWAGTIEGVLRGLMNVLDAAGVLDDRLRRTLQGAVDVASAVGQINFEDLASPGSIGAFAQIAGGLVGMLSAHFGDDGSEQEARKREIRAMQELEQALRDLEGAVITNLSAVERREVINFVSQMMAAFGSDPNTRVQLTTSSSLRRAKMLEEATGISFLGEEGQVDRERFMAAADRFRDMDLGAFGEDVQGRIEAFNFVISALGDAAGTATERLDMFLSTLQGVPEAAGFAEELRKRIEKDGPEAAEEWLQGMAKVFAQPGGFKQLVEQFPFLSRLTPEEFAQILQEGIDLTGAAAEAGDRGTTRSVQIARSITEIQANEVVAWLEEIAFWVKEQATILRGGELPEGAARGVLPGPAGAAVSQELTNAVRRLATALEAPAGPSAATSASAGPTFTVHGDISVNPEITREQFNRVWDLLGKRIWLERNGDAF